MYHVLCAIYNILYCTVYYLCKEVLDAGDWVEHEAGQGDHDPHQDQPLVVSPECIKHEPWKNVCEICAKCVTVPKIMRLHVIKHN